LYHHHQHRPHLAHRFQRLAELDTWRAVIRAEGVSMGYDPFGLCRAERLTVERYEWRGDNDKELSLHGMTVFFDTLEKYGKQLSRKTYLCITITVDLLRPRTT